jgi:hypothetical protein
MRRRTARLRPLLLLTLAIPQARGGDLVPEEGRLREHVERLASPEFEGRRGEGARKAAEYLADQFLALHLEPLFGASFTQSIPSRDGGPGAGRNVGALVRGSDPAAKDEWVIVSAHFDHLGIRGDRFYPGADDNASGVAMMLEVARSIVLGDERPRRGVMFVGFDLEEVGLFGSRYFVEHPPVPLDQVSLFITADMIGRSLAGVCDPYVFLMGTEHAPGLRAWVSAAADGAPVKVGLLGSDLLLLDRSDYGPFRRRKVPYLFFSTGESPVYHTTRDVAATLNYPKVTAISRVIHGVAFQAACAEHVPPWSPRPDHPLAEALTIRDVFGTLLRNRDALKIGPTQVTLMTNAMRTLDAAVERGSITPEERTGVIRVARVVMISLF